MHSQNDIQTLRKIIEKSGYQYSWIYDKHEEFIHKNKIYDKRFQTVLLGKRKQVIIIGNPVLNPKLEELYFKKLGLTF